MKVKFIFLSLLCATTLNAIDYVKDKPAAKLRGNVPATIVTLINEAIQKPSTDQMSLTYRKVDLDEINQTFKDKKPLTPQELAEHRINSIIVLEPHNFPEGKNFELFARDVEGIITDIMRFNVKSDGTLVASKDGKDLALSAYHIFVSDYLPGEPIYYILLSSDGKHYASVEVVPTPIETESVAGYAIKGKLTNPIKKLYTFEGTGFAPNEIVTAKLLSQNEQTISKVQADANGKVVVNASPAQKGRTGGEALIALTGKKGTATLRYRWGSAAY